MPKGYIDAGLTESTLQGVEVVGLGRRDRKNRKELNLPEASDGDGSFAMSLLSETGIWFPWKDRDSRWFISPLLFGTHSSTSPVVCKVAMSVRCSTSRHTIPD